DENGYPIELYPIPCVTVEAIYNKTGYLFLKFYFQNGNSSTFPYSEIIHLRDDFYDNDIFGEPPGKALTSLMDIVTTTDQGIVKAIKNSNAVKWLLKYTQSLRPEDLKKNVEDFVNNYLSIESSTVGAAATDAKADAIQVEPKDYVPNAAQIDRTTERIYSFFNTNKKIVQSSYNEDEWISYYEARIEPDAMQMSAEYTRKLFIVYVRGFGNNIIFESSSLQYTSMKSKFDLVQCVDRRMMIPYKLRAIMNLVPIVGGDTPIRWLDTAPVTEGDND